MCDAVDRYGPGVWELLHRAVYRVQDTPGGLDGFVDLVCGMATLFPCDTCRPHIVEEAHALVHLVEGQRARPAAALEDALALWVFGFHNRVNARRGARGEWQAPRSVPDTLAKLRRRYASDDERCSARLTG